METLPSIDRDRRHPVCSEAVYLVRKKTRNIPVRKQGRNVPVGKKKERNIPVKVRKKDMYR
jgi:hypothetical protein